MSVMRRDLNAGQHTQASASGGIDRYAREPRVVVICDRKDFDACRQCGRDVRL
jgi:hypothetical protein